MNDDADWFSDEKATFGDRLNGAREAAGLSQKQLASKLGVKTDTIRAWEDDLKEPRANRLQMLSGLLGVSLKWLLTGTGEGLEAPVDTTEMTPELAGLLTEIREVRTQMSQNLERLGQLEKRLRAALKE